MQKAKIKMAYQHTKSQSCSRSTYGENARVTCRQTNQRPNLRRFSLSGMTLIEVAVSTGLIALLSLIFSGMVSRGFAAYRIGRQTIESQERVARVMREFEYSARAATEIITADPDELAFYRFYNANEAYPTKVRYFIDGSQFKVGKTEPAGTAPNITYPADDERIDFLVSDVTNLDLLFEYYNGNGALLDQPVTTSDIRSINLSISVDQNSVEPPNPVTETTRITLRNKKTNL